MARKSRRQILKRNLDRTTAQIIKLRDENTCQRCGHKVFGQGCHWAHIYGRRSLRLRWDLLNSLVLCAGCHRWWHENPVESHEWFADYFPARYSYLLKVRQQKPRIIRINELAEWLAEKKQKLAELKGGE